jgi:predicted protein tyrosine phosphatase
MIYKITIHELSEAIRFSYKENYGGYNSWICTVDDEDQQKVSRLKRNFLTGKSNFKFFSQLFYDWSDEDNDQFITKNIDTMGPRKSQIQSIITFIKGELVNSDVVYNLGINCFAGISRSTAIGIIAWVLQGKTTEEALQEILKVRPEAFPNLRILKFATEILGIDIFTPIKEWKEKTSKEIYMPVGGWAW